MRKIFLGISSGILYTFLSILISIFTAPYILKYISKEEYGVFFLFNNIIVWSGVLNIGLRGSFKLQLAKAIGSKSEWQPLASTIFISQSIIACFVILCGFIISSLPNLSFGLRFTSPVFLILTISFAISILSNSFSVFLSVQNKDSIVYTLRSLVAILSPLISILGLYWGLGLKALAISAILSELLIFLFLAFNIRKENKGIFNYNLFDKKILFSSISIGKWFLIGFLSQLFIRHSDLFIISKYCGPENITSFIFSSKLFVLALLALQISLKVISPQITKIYHSNSGIGIDINITIILKLIIATTFLLGFGIYILNETFVDLWVGHSFFLGHSINTMLLLSFLFSSLTLCIRTIQTSFFQFKEQKLSALSEGISHLIFSTILGYYYGLEGIIFGILFATVIGFLFSILQSQNNSSFKMMNEIKDIILYFLVILSGILFVGFFPNLKIYIITFLVILGLYMFIFFKDLKGFITELKNK